MRNDKKRCYPRTPAEFLTGHRAIVGRCSCGRATQWIKPESLIQRFGPDFDIYEGFAEVVEAFNCDVCGQPQALSVHVPPSTTVGLMPSHEALARDLEARAVAQARDSLVQPGMRADQGAGGRRRKFGIRGR